MKNFLWLPARLVTENRLVKSVSLTLFLIPFASAKIYSQIDPTRYFNPGLPILVMDDYLKPDFAWNMKGNLQALINEGINSLDEGNLVVAAANLNKAVKIDSSLWMIHYYRGICYKKTGVLDSAEQSFLKSITLNPNQAETYIELAEDYISIGKFNKASRLIDTGIEKNPTLPQSYYNLAAIAFMENNPNKARKLYKKANEVGPKYPDAYLMQGLLTAYRSNTTEALALIGKAIEVDPAYSTGYFWRGLLLLHDKKIQECLNEWNNLIQYNPGNSMYATMRAYLYIELKQFDKAFIDLKNALKAQEVNENKFTGKQSVLDKKIDLNAAANYLIANGYGLDETAFEFLKKGFCLLLTKDEDGALESLTHAENVQPSATVYFLKAIAFEHRGQHYEAMEYYTRALKRDNDIFDAHKKRSIYRLELQDWTGVHEDLENMFRLDPTSPVAYRLSGLVKAHQKDFAGAEKDLSKFIESDTTDMEIYRTRIVCYAMLGQRDEAHPEIVRLLKTKPNNWALREEMVGYYLILKDTAKAILAVQQFIDLRPNLYLPYKKLIAILIDKNDFERARLIIPKIKSLIPESYQPLEYSEIYLWEGMIAAHKKDFNTAIDHFSKALKRNNNNLDARYHRAKLYHQAGQLKRAKADYEILANASFKDSKIIYESL